MSIPGPFILRALPHPARQNCIEAIRKADDDLIVKFEKPKRSNILNAKMWAVLTQLEPIDWYGFHLTKEEWKDVITASLRRLKVVPGLDGGFVVCGQSTRNMPSKDIWDVIESAYALGSERGIRFVEPIERLREAA